MKQKMSKKNRTKFKEAVRLIREGEMQLINISNREYNSFISHNLGISPLVSCSEICMSIEQYLKERGADYNKIQAGTK